MSFIETKYFMLKPRSKFQGDIFAQASREAIRSYASVIKQVDFEFALQLESWADREEVFEGTLRREVDGGKD